MEENLPLKTEVKPEETASWQKDLGENFILMERGIQGAPQNMSIREAKEGRSQGRLHLRGITVKVFLLFCSLFCFCLRWGLT